MSPSFGLACLALRRLLPPRAALGLLALLLLVATGDWELSRHLPQLDDLDARGRSFARYGVWRTASLLIVPLLIARTCLLARHWRTIDRAWLAPRPSAPLGNAVAVWFGTWCAGLLVLVIVALAAEVAVGAAGEASHRLYAQLEHPAVTLLGDERSATWIELDSQVMPHDPDAVLRLHVVAAPGSGPAAEIAFQLGARNGTRTHALVSGPTTCQLRLGDTPEQLTLERTGGGDAVIVMPADSAEVLVPCASDRLASVELWIRFMLAWTAWVTLAFALGTVLRPLLAATLLCSMWILVWSRGVHWVPGGDLFATFGRIEQQIVPAAAPLAQFAIALTLVVVALAVLTRTWSTAGRPR